MHRKVWLWWGRHWAALTTSYATVYTCPSATTALVLLAQSWQVEGT